MVSENILPSDCSSESLRAASWALACFEAGLRLPDVYWTGDSWADSLDGVAGLSDTTTGVGSIGPGGGDVITVVAGTDAALTGLSEMLALMATDVANSETTCWASVVALAAEAVGAVASVEGDLRALIFFRRVAFCCAGADGPSVSEELLTISFDRPRGMWFGHNWIVDGSLTT